MTKALSNGSTEQSSVPPADAATPRQRVARRWPSVLGALLLGLIPVAAFILLWWAWAASGGQDSHPFLPTPGQVASRFKELVSAGTIFDDTLASLRRVLIGVGLAAAIGIPLGILMGVSSIWRKILSPTFEILRPIPIAAWVPLVIVVFGIGETPAEALIFVGSLFPILLNTTSAVAQTNQIHLRAARMLGANRLQLIRLVNLPAALPGILVGLRLSLGIGWWVVILAELLAVRSGLGYRLVIAQQQIQTDTIVVAMIFIGIVGWALNWLAELLERRLLRWMD